MSEPLSSQIHVPFSLYIHVLLGIPTPSHQSLYPFTLYSSLRPVILLPELARYSAAQCLNRIVELLPQDDKQNRRGSSITVNANEVAPASFTPSSPQNNRRSMSPITPKEEKQKRNSSSQSNHRSSLRVGRHSSITRRSSQDGQDINAVEEAAKRRGVFIRTYMEEKVHAGCPWLY